MAERNIVVHRPDRVPTSKGRSELVERKGIGHPDSIADGIAEAVSRELCRMYPAECGERILRFNVDRNEVAGGQSAPDFGGGEVLEPAYVMVLGRAIDEVVYEGCRRVRLPVRRTRPGHTPATTSAAPSCRGKASTSTGTPSWTAGSAGQPGPPEELRAGCGRGPLRRRPPGQRHFLRGGFAPCTGTEEPVPGIERSINGEMKARRGMSATGKDVKAMAGRNGNDISLTIACAMISSRAAGAAECRSLMEEMKALVRDRCCERTEHNVDAPIDHADRLDGGDPRDHCLTVTGLSMENGDDGPVGRGNRVNGLITPFRPMSMEAASGKNPATHVGKPCNVLANNIANDIAGEAGEELSEVRVRLLSQIGSPIDRPVPASIDLAAPGEELYRRWAPRAREIADARLADIGSPTRKPVDGEVPTFWRPPGPHVHTAAQIGRGTARGRSRTGQGMDIFKW